MINEEVIKSLNELLQATFQMNSFADNCAYWLDYNYYVESADLFHHKFAHMFPEWADTISDAMIKLNIRPVRLGLTENIVEYENHSDLFVDVDRRMVEYRQKICDTIEIAEMNDERNIVIVLEDLLLTIMPYVKQTDIWAIKADEIDGVSKFDKYFDDFSKMIK